jgi:hypothetical protein
MKDDTIVGIALGALGLGILVLLARKPEAAAAPTMVQPTAQAPPGMVGVPVTYPVYPEPTPEAPEEPMEYGAPEETGAGGYTPIVMSNSDCFMECLMAGYLNGSCMWASEAPPGATRIIECLIDGSRHCGSVGLCGCYCWGSYEG